MRFQITEFFEWDLHARIALVSYSYLNACNALVLNLQKQPRATDFRVKRACYETTDQDGFMPTFRRLFTRFSRRFRRFLRDFRADFSAFIFYFILFFILAVCFS